MKKLLFYFITVSLLSSCSQKKETVMINILTGGERKCWFHFYRDTLKPYEIGFCIDKDGTIKEYNRVEKSFNVSRGPIEPVPIWKIINDSTMMFGEGFYFKSLQ